MKEFKTNLALVLILSSFVTINVAAADTIINNYPNAPAQPQQPAMSQQQQPAYNQAPMSYSTAPTPPGTYQQKNADGSYNTVYTTGDKQPYIVDSPQQQQPVIQPYVYPNMPTGGNGPQNNRPGR